MSINNTYLSAAITATQLTLQVNSATGITAPNYTTGVGVTYLYVDKELMLVTAVSGTYITVNRGMLGTIAASHVITTTVVAGLYSDFPLFQPTIDAFNTGLNRAAGQAGPVASAATIVATGQLFHVTGSTATNIITPPANFVEGTITIIADGVWTFTSSAVQNGIYASGTVTTAHTAVSFTYDPISTYWIPSRVS